MCVGSGLRVAKLRACVPAAPSAAQACVPSQWRHYYGFSFQSAPSSFGRAASRRGPPVYAPAIGTRLICRRRTARCSLYCVWRWCWQASAGRATRFEVRLLLKHGTRLAHKHGSTLSSLFIPLDAIQRLQSQRERVGTQLAVALRLPATAGCANQRLRVIGDRRSPIGDRPSRIRTEPLTCTAT